MTDPFLSAPGVRPLDPAETEAVRAEVARVLSRRRVGSAFGVPLVSGLCGALATSSGLTFAVLALPSVWVVWVAWRFALRWTPGAPSAEADLGRPVRAVAGTFGRSGDDIPLITLDGVTVAAPSHWPRLSGRADALVFTPISLGGRRGPRLLMPPLVVEATLRDPGSPPALSLSRDVAARRPSGVPVRFSFRAS